MLTDGCRWRTKRCSSISSKLTQPLASSQSQDLQAGMTSASRLWAYVCRRVCVYICVYLCVRLYVYVCMYACMYVRADLCVSPLMLCQGVVSAALILQSATHGQVSGLSVASSYDIGSVADASM